MRCFFEKMKQRNLLQDHQGKKENANKIHGENEVTRHDRF